MTNQYIKRVESDIREVVAPRDLDIVVSNIGITPDFSAIYTSNSGQHTAFVQVSLKKEHSVSSFEYMRRVRAKLTDDLPELSTYFQSGGLVDAVVNLGLPAPIDIQVSGNNQKKAYQTAAEIAGEVRQLKDASDVLIPQDLDYPGIQLNISREMAGRMGVSSKEAVDNVITALTSDSMIAPSYWVDPKNGNNYMLTVQYPETQVNSITDLKQIPLHAAGNVNPTELDAVSDIKMINTPTEVDHYQIQRVIDVYVAPRGEDLGSLAHQVDKIIANTKVPENIRVTMRGSVEGMRQSFKSFAIGLILSIILVYLILMAQFSSFIDPLIILLAIPPGITGVILFLLATHTTVNVMSLMGVIMMTGIVVSNSILIVEFTRDSSERRHADPGSGGDCLSRTLAAGLDDLIGNDSRHDSDGPCARSGQRTICSPGPRHHRRSHDVGRGNCFHRSRCVSIDPSSGRRATGASHAKLRSTIESWTRNRSSFSAPQWGFRLCPAQGIRKTCRPIRHKSIGRNRCRVCLPRPRRSQSRIKRRPARLRMVKQLGIIRPILPPIPELKRLCR